MTEPSSTPPTPINNPAPEPSPRDPSLPKTPKPGGPLLVLAGKPETVWFPPEKLRSPGGFDEWIPGVQEFAAIDAVLLRMTNAFVLTPGSSVHLQIPGDTPRYLSCTLDRSTKIPAGKSVNAPAGTFLLIQQSTGIARIIALKAAEGAKDRVAIQELIDAAIPTAFEVG